MSWNWRGSVDTYWKASSKISVSAKNFGSARPEEWKMIVAMEDGALGGTIRMPRGPGPYLAAAAAVTAGALGSAYCAYRAYLRTRIPSQWVQVGTLKEINAYPIKSCGPVIVDEAELAILGLKSGWLRDRVLMVVDQKSNFVTARVYPEMLLVHPSVRNAILSLTHVDMQPLHVNLAEVAALQKVTTATVWGDPVPVWDCGKEASDWFCKLLDKPEDSFRLVYYANQTSRPLRLGSSKTRIYNFTKNDSGALPDEVSYNLINKASVEDLNTRLVNCKASTRNFRPNFVLEGAGPYDEDGWKFVKIGDHVFQVIKPCGRCVLTTIDPETGVRDPNSEPLQTLKSYRKHDTELERKEAGQSPRMGLQMALRSPPGGTLRINDPIYVPA